MKEYRIIYDKDQKEPFLCYEREVSTSAFFKDPWEFMNSTPTHGEAIIFVTCHTGRYIGTWLKDGTHVADNTEIILGNQPKSNLEDTAKKEKKKNVITL
jgi:hypothetical protein